MPVSSIGVHNARLIFIQIMTQSQTFWLQEQIWFSTKLFKALLLPEFDFPDIYKHLLMGHAKLYKLFDASKHNLHVVLIRIHFTIFKQIRAFQDWIWSAGANGRAYSIMIAIITNICFNWSWIFSSYSWESFVCRPVVQTVSVKLLYNKELAF